MADGTLTIKTKIDNSGINKQLDVINQKIKIQEEKYNNTKKATDEVTNSLKNNNNELQKMEQEYNKIKIKIAEMQAYTQKYSGLGPSNESDMVKYGNIWDPSIISKVQTYESEIEELNQKKKELRSSITNVTNSIKKEEAEQEKLTLKLKEQKVQYENLKGSKEKLELKSFEKDSINIDKVNSGIKSSIKSLSKYALALLSIRTVYSALSSAASAWLSSNDSSAKQLTANINYMKWAIGKSLQPVIETLVNWMYKLLSLINMISQALFKVNLFANASAGDFASASESTSAIASNTKETTTNLASFDNLDVLNEDNNSSSGSSGSGTDFTMPSFDLSGMDMAVPEWLQWILNNGDLVISILGGIAIGLAALKLGFSGIQALGIGIAVTGIIYTIQSLLEYLKDPTFENFGKIITGIGLAIAGVAIALEAWPVVLAGVIVAIIGLIISNWDKIKTFALGIADWFEEHLGILGEEISRLIKDGLENFESLFKGIKQIFDGIIQIAKGDLAGGLKTIFTGIVNVIISALNTLISAINLLLSPARGIIVAFGKVTGKNWTMSDIKIPSIPKLKLAKGAIVNNPRRGVDTTIGEDGSEMVLPLEKNTEWMDTLADKIASKTGGGNISIKANGTLGQLIRLLKLEIDKENSRVGSSLIIGGNA